MSNDMRNEEGMKWFIYTGCMRMGYIQVTRLNVDRSLGFFLSEY